MSFAVFMGFFGALVGVGICLIWDYMKNIRDDIDIIDIIEHYHYGLIFIILSNFAGVLHSFFVWLGIIMILDEFRHNHPFAYKSKHFIYSLIIGLILMFLLLYYNCIYNHSFAPEIFRAGNLPV